MPGQQKPWELSKVCRLKACGMTGLGCPLSTSHTICLPAKGSGTDGNHIDTLYLKCSISESLIYVDAVSSRLNHPMFSKPKRWTPEEALTTGLPTPEMWCASIANWTVQSQTYCICSRWVEDMKKTIGHQDLTRCYCNAAHTTVSEGSVISAIEADGSWCDKEFLPITCFSFNSASHAESVKTNLLVFTLEYIR